MSEQLTVMIRFAVLCLALAGCPASSPSGPQRAHVTGKITFAGQPVPYGTVSFIPPEGSGLPVSGAEIRDGKYDVRNLGGVPVGTHRVEINGWATPPQKMEAADLVAPAAPPLIPEKYNTKSELSLTVESNRPLEQNFDLE